MQGQTMSYEYRPLAPARPLPNHFKILLILEMRKKSVINDNGIRLMQSHRGALYSHRYIVRNNNEGLAVFVAY
jgi:hypothetical protein